MRLVDADALIKTLETQDYSNAPNTLEEWTPQDMTNAEIFDINNAPTVDAEPVKHGHWIDINENGSLWECSICGDRSCCCGNYCMECGAKMDEVEE